MMGDDTSAGDGEIIGGCPVGATVWERCAPPKRAHGRGDSYLLCIVWVRFPRHGEGGVGGWKRVERSEDRPQRGYVVGVLVGCWWVGTTPQHAHLVKNVTFSRPFSPIMPIRNPPIHNQNPFR